MGEPWVDGQYLQGTETQVLLSQITPAKVVSADPRRVALLISIQQGGGCQLGFQSSSVVNTNIGFVLNANTPYIQMLFSEVGGLCQREFWALSASTTTTLTIWQVLYTPAGGAT